MNKLFLSSVLSSTLFIGTNSAIAEQYKYLKGVTVSSPSPSFQIYGITSLGGETLLNTWDGNPEITTNYFSSFSLDSAADDYTSKININITENASTTLVNSYQIEYDIKENTFTKLPNPDPEISSGQKVIYPKMLETLLKENEDGSVQIGPDVNDIDITAEGLNIDGNPVITKKDNGEIHIGKNSLITTSEEQALSDGTKVQPLYAKDANGNKIPINIDGSKLLIDGVEVFSSSNSTQVITNKNNISTNASNISTNKSNIKNLGEGVAGTTALTAALTALPQTSKESKLSCGVGTGLYSSRYALGFGCASKVNERVDINAGGSYVFGGSKSYGEGALESGVIKAGFVFKLGKLKKLTQISIKEKDKLKEEISSLKANNENIISQNKALIARLERLEKIALSEINSQDLTTRQLP